MNAITTMPAVLRGSARSIVSSLAVALLAISASAQTIGFINDPATTQYGTYADNGGGGGGLNIGRPMTVTGAGIEVFQLGVYDYQSDGLAQSHVVTLFQNQTAIASVTVPAGTAAPLINAFRLVPLGAPLYLPAGNYSIVAYQMNGTTTQASDPYGNGNAAGFNGGGNVSAGNGIYDFVTNPSPAYPANTSGEQFAAVSFTYTNAVAVSSTWTGLGADNNWSTSGNWGSAPSSPVGLTFAGSTRLTNTNDLLNLLATGITFDAAAGTFTLNGNGITLGGNITFNGVPAAPITETINLPLTPSGSFAVDTRTNGNITINGNVAGSGATLTQTSTGNVGTLTLGGTNSFAGFIINGGTNRITGTTAIAGNGSSRFCLANANAALNGTLFIENGANLTVSGNFVDAAVIGRDGGKGTVIQNGGTFTFSPANNQLFLVGATGNAATRAEYDMNGGLFDMKNFKLGVGLGAGVLITGVVNQVSGVITNVGNLDLGTLTASGKGIYNLSGGSIYIGASGITTFNGIYSINLGGGTVGAYANWSSSLAMTLTGSNGPVTFNPAGNTITLSGILSGSGGLTVNGSGVLDLAGANTYTGNTMVTAGSTLQFDTTGTSFGPTKLANGATLNLNYSGTRIAAAAYTNGVALSVGTYNSGNLPGFITGSGNLQVASGISTGLWDGGGANNNWSTGGNWDQDSVPGFPIGLTFAGSARLANNNDLSSITASGITFDAAAGAFMIGGNDITLSGGIGFNANPAAPVTQTVNLGMTWNANQTLDMPTNGNLTLGGNITSGNALTKTGAGTLTLGGIGGFSSYILNGGTNTITGNVTVSGTGGGSRFALGNVNPAFNGTLVIQPGAILNVFGSYVDALVIGRDSGSGTIIQNGGTFTFNPDNNGYIFVGASSNPGTRAEYDMNGGVLDMSGNTLSIGLADGGTTVTGRLNQAGGIINNVGKFWLSPVQAGGLAIYTLSGGSIYIGSSGITTASGNYAINLGGGTVGALTSWSSSLNMTLTNLNGSVTFDPAGNTIALSGILSGNGGFTVTNGGTLELSGANTYTGDTIVSAGSTLQLDATGSSAGPFRLVDGAILNLNYSGTYAIAHVSTNGVALANGTYNAGNLPGFIVGSGDLLIAGNISAGIWDGGGANSYWSTSGNWDQNVVPIFPIGLTFAGSTRLTNTNDLSGITASSITFDSAAGVFNLSGNDITLIGNIGFNGNPAAPVTQSANLNMTWSANKTIDTPTNGNLTLGGNITTSGNDMTKIGAGTLTLGGVDSFAGYIINGGTNIIMGNVALSGTGGSRFCLANANTAFNGTLVIQPGAAFDVSGNWTDAGVIGRDGGVGTVTQNGGTFNFDMGNQNYLFVGASGNPNTRSTYNMNGGLLDMNDKTLGIALGAGVLITGVVNQVSGVITNVSNLYFSPFFTQGHGIYNLTGGSLYIGSGGITVFSGGGYEMNLGGGTVGAYANWSSSLNLNLTGNNGPVTFDTAANTITLSGVLSGSGGLAVGGSGTLELSGANTYTGNTTVNAGTLQLDLAGTSASAIHIVSGAMLNLTYGGSLTVPACYTNGIALSSGVYTSGNLPGFITGAGSLTISAAAPPVVHVPVISGGNLILTGSGGTAGAGYTWLSATNLTTPVVSWTTNTTGNFDGSGNFSNAIPITTSPAQFFRLRTP